MTILITIILTVLVCLGFLAWVLESSNMDYPILGLIAYLIWPVSIIFLAIYLYCFEEMYDNYKNANRLNTIVETLEHKGEYPSEDYNWHIAKAKQFAKGCMSAYNEKEQLKFQ